MATKRRQTACILLAAGKGTRMKSSLPKVLHQVCGKSLLEHVLDALAPLKLSRTAVVVGYKAAQVKKVLGDRVEYIRQARQLGTAHALLQAQSSFSDFRGDILVIYPDMPLLSSQTLARLLKAHRRGRSALTLVTDVREEPSGAGRVLRENGRIRRIVEEKDATPEQRDICEINAGIYCFEAKALFEALPEVGRDNSQQEYYLTDVVGILADKGYPVRSLEIGNGLEIVAVDSRKDLAEVANELRRRILDDLMDSGVTVVDPANTYISKTVTIGSDTAILPNTYIEGATTIGRNCRIGPQTYLCDCQIGDDVEIVMSHVSSSEIKSGVQIGPYSHIRAQSVIEERAEIGNYVEVKKSRVAADVKAKHLSYIGDAELGERVNIGAGTITANYDGHRKHKTTIRQGASTGSNTVLVAPVEMGAESKTGAGAVVTKDVPDGATWVGVPAKSTKGRKRKTTGGQASRKR